MRREHFKLRAWGGPGSSPGQVRSRAAAAGLGLGSTAASAAAATAPERPVRALLANRPIPCRSNPAVGYATACPESQHQTPTGWLKPSSLGEHFTGFPWISILTVLSFAGVRPPRLLLTTKKQAFVVPAHQVGPARLGHETWLKSGKPDFSCLDRSRRGA